MCHLKPVKCTDTRGQATTTQQSETICYVYNILNCTDTRGQTMAVMIQNILLYWLNILLQSFRFQNICCTDSNLETQMLANYEYHNICNRSIDHTKHSGHSGICLVHTLSSGFSELKTSDFSRIASLSLDFKSSLFSRS